MKNQKAKQISIANQKGGVGKTTTAVQVASNLAKKNYRTLLIDLDPQSNATSIFALSSYSIEETTYSIFKDKTVSKELVQSTEWENLFLIPSILNLSEIDTLLAGSVDGFFRLQDSLLSISEDFDFIIMDCPPNLGMLTLNALLSCHYVIIPLQASKFSLEGIKTIIDTIQTLNQKFRANIKTLGALMTMHDERTIISRTLIEEMKELLPIFHSYISRSVVVEEAHLIKEPLWKYAPKSKVNLQYQKLTEEILYGIQKGSID